MLLNGVQLEAPLDGTMLLMTKTTISRASSARSARFSAGTRSTSPTSRSAAPKAAAVGVVNLDEPPAIPAQVLTEIRALKQLKNAWLVRV